MSEEAKSFYQAQPRRPKPRLLVVSNPDNVDTDNSPLWYPPSQPPPSNKSYAELQQPLKAPPPPPLTTNLPPASLGQYPASRPNPSNQSLSSPSSTSSRAFESTPPPSTPGQSNPPDDISSEGTLGQDGVLVGYPDVSETTPPSACSSRKAGFIQRFGAFPKHRRRTSRPQTSPITSVPDVSPSTSSSTVNEPLMQERINLLVTKDAEHLVTVDVYGVKTRDAAYIRERIFSKLQIRDDEQHRQAFYRTEIGKYALGEALTDDQLLRLCIERGDENGTVKLLVSESQASLHEPSHESSQPSPTVDTVPPPVLPPFAQNYAPLKPQRRYSRSRRDSLSSTSERQPPDPSAGYEASVSDDLDMGDREPRRPPLRPSPPQQYPLRPQPLPPRPPSPPAYGRSQSPGGGIVSPDRGPAQPYHSPVSLRPERPRGSALPIVPGQVVSPDVTRFYDAGPLNVPLQRGVHIRSGSDAAADRERTLQAAEQVQDYPSYRRQRGGDDKERESPDKARSPQSLTRDRIAGPLRRAKNTMREQRVESTWQMVAPNGPISENGRARPSPVQDSHVSPSRPHVLGSPYSQLQIPRPPHIPVPPAPSDARSHGKSSRSQKMVPIPMSYVVRYKDAGGRDGKDSMPQSPPRQLYGLNPAKSMGDLRSIFNARDTTLRRTQDLPVSASQRPSTAERANASEHSIPIRHEHAVSETSIAKSYEGPRGPLASPTGPHHIPRPTGPPNYPPPPAPQAAPQAFGGYATSAQDPYPRPHSALDNDSNTSTITHYQSGRAIQSPNVDHLSPDAIYRPLNPIPSHSHSTSSSYREDAYHPVPSFGPRPQPRSDRSHIEAYGLTLGTASRGGRTPPRSPITSKPPGNDIKEQEHKPLVEAAEPVRRTLSSLPLQEDETPSSTESTIRREDVSRLLDMFEQSGTGSSSATMVPKFSQGPNTATRTHTPPRSFDTSPLYPTQSSISTGTLISVNSDDDSDLWAKPPPKPSNSQINRPVLPPIDTDSSPDSQNEPLPPRDNSKIPANFPPPPGYIPDTPPLRNSRRNNTSAKKLQDQRISRFDNNFEVTWAPRPPPEEVFERLEEYFPEHDIDEPVIDMPSGGTSPTSAEPNQPLAMEKQKFRHKKSIRLVAEEHKRRIDRRSRMEPAANANNTLRKRNTKLWGSRLEEVPTHDQALLPTAAGPPSDNSPGTAKPIFRWVRGELIGKGTYGKVYLALNATTGEMIAVKQVEMPRTASDRDDSRQVSVVEALKLESETLKDLDHPNIVQYLGFEETPTFLSIFLEYVPGGSIASCLRKHGKFDEDVTKSFTGQILSGLEYLHSKGILHRDLKADNILVETTGICKISDFGISKRTDDIDMVGAYTSMQGTVFWMAPEVIDANKRGYNSKIDIWSVGCVVFEMWTGQRPWSGKEAMAVLLQLYQTKEGPPVPQDIVLSQMANDFRQKCFATDPDQRPTAAELRKHPYLELQPDWTFNGFK